MSALRSLPRRLSSLLAGIAQSPGPVHVIVEHEAWIDIVAQVCREAGLPLSPPRRTDRNADTGYGYLTTPQEPISHAKTVLRLSDIPSAASNPVAEARIRATLEEHWRSGVDLPALAVWPSGSRLPAGSRLLPGKALADRRGPGLGEDAGACLDGPDGAFPLGLRSSCASLLQSWQQLRGRAPVTAVVSSAPPSHQILCTHLASGAAALLNARYAGELTGNQPPQGPEQPAERVSRLASQLRLDPAQIDVAQVAGRHVLLVGASWRDGWTMTVSGQLLLSAGAASVRPFTLTSDIRPARHR